MAVIITIIELELKAPHGADLAALQPLMPVFLTYILSFVYLGIYWNNHHHMLQATDRVTGGILWANLHLLFWLSLVPFTTSWLGENHLAAVPAAVYGIVLLAAALAYYLLQTLIIRDQGEGSLVRTAIGRDLKGKLSPVLYVIGIGLSYVAALLGILVYAGLALMWLVPDRRIERTMQHRVS